MILGPVLAGLLSLINIMLVAFVASTIGAIDFVFTLFMLKEKLIQKVFYVILYLTVIS
jgi:hypothetical protein